MMQLARNGSSRTAPYWRIAKGSVLSPNWIAKWFLYHKFRYRDGRNKSKHPRWHNADRSNSSKRPRHQYRSRDENPSYLNTNVQGAQSSDYEDQQVLSPPDYSSNIVGTRSLKLLHSTYSLPRPSSYRDVVYTSNVTTGKFTFRTNAN